MQSSYNVIKNRSVKNTGLREIVTSSDTPEINPEVEDNIKNHIESYESLAKSILENARNKSEQIVIRAYEDARTIEEEALVKAEHLKNEAYERGHQEGYHKAYHETMQQTKIESEAIIASAMELLNNAKAEYEEYLQIKTQEINDLIITIANTVLKKEVEDRSSINSMIYEAIERSKMSEKFIIRCNSIYVDELKDRSDIWKKQLGFLGDIFIIGDDSLEPGNAVIDKGNGKIITGIDYALQRIEEILEGKD
jgi:flagellar assembly protein FliH